MRAPLHEPKQETWRVIRPIAEARRVRTKRSLASLVLGQGSTAEAYLFQWGVRDGAPLRLLWTAWYLGAFAGLLALVEAVPAHFVWVAALMVPLPVLTMALLSKDLVLEILHEMDFYLIQVLQTVALAHGVMETWRDERCFFWLFYVPSLIVAPLVDGYPAKFRPRFLQLYFGGMLCVLLGWNAFELSHKTFHFFTYKVGDLTTLALFYLRQIYAATWHGDNFVLISCAMYTDKENVVLDTEGSALPCQQQAVNRVVPPRAYSFKASHSPTDWRSPAEGAAAGDAASDGGTSSLASGADLESLASSPSASPRAAGDQPPPGAARRSSKASTPSGVPPLGPLPEEDEEEGRPAGRERTGAAAASEAPAASEECVEAERAEA